ncbi:hypothetical protein KR074_006950 [Drosophila pseudoananassae]|nr:hypothetical protein KR074_006950 [Drosophila pseudoananassae]
MKLLPLLWLLISSSSLLLVSGEVKSANTVTDSKVIAGNLSTAPLGNATQGGTSPAMVVPVTPAALPAVQQGDKNSTKAEAPVDKAKDVTTTTDSGAKTRKRPLPTSSSIPSASTPAKPATQVKGDATAAASPSSNTTSSATSTTTTTAKPQAAGSAIVAEGQSLSDVTKASSSSKPNNSTAATTKSAISSTSTTTTTTTTTSTTTTTTPKPTKPPVAFGMNTHKEWEEEQKQESGPPKATDKKNKDKPAAASGASSQPLPVPSSTLAEPVTPVVQELTSNLADRGDNVYVVPIVTVLLTVPLAIGVVIIMYRRFRDMWSTRHYRRMDFLVDGMYND